MFFHTDSCHENVPQTRFSSCCKPFSLSQKNRNRTSYVTGSCHVTFWPWAVFAARDGKCNILKRKKHNKKIFLAKIFFSVVFHMFWTIEKRVKIFRFSGTLKAWKHVSILVISGIAARWQVEMDSGLDSQNGDHLDRSSKSVLGTLGSRFAPNEVVLEAQISRQIS